MGTKNQSTTAKSNLELVPKRFEPVRAHLPVRAWWESDFGVHGAECLFDLQVSGTAPSTK
ncbi:MAG: hypothetical protein M3O30_19380 [Planctomycetota bacterium]|nr:hypothetical protein [Planctomycetota bacterium]